jgi:single-strand DNA-binding protein
MNLIILKGHLGSDPKLEEKGETKFCSFSLATSEKFKDKQETVWHNIKAFNKQAELCEKYLKKGDALIIEGKQVNRSYDKADGSKGYASEVIMRAMHFVGGGAKQSEKGESLPPSPTASDAPTPSDDLPF